MTFFEQKLTLLNEEIQAFEANYQRAPHSVQLLAVTKGQPLSAILAAIEAGQRHFGENYLQEALGKIKALSDYPDCVWHFIGPIQRNKTRGIASHFAWVHSVECELIAKRLNDQRPDSLPILNICLEVNLDQEAQKSGISPEDVPALLTYCLSLPRLRVRGLMAIPARLDDFNAQREVFHRLYLLQQALINQGFQLDTLSMGMSHDREAAIAEGATIIRIGQKLFGERH